MKVLKKKTKKPEKISGKPQITQVTKICFSFEYVTTNKNYNFDIFTKDKSKKCTAYDALFERMSELSQINTIEALQRGKKSGLEKIPVNQLSKSMQDICKGIDIISNDSKLIVFRFYNHNYRLICKDDIIHPNLMYVIAFDFDYSAYNHG